MSGRSRESVPWDQTQISCLPAALVVAAVPVGLGAMGFTGAGIAASSIAAKMMSAAAVANGGGVAAGSLVATLQSVGRCPAGGWGRCDKPAQDSGTRPSLREALCASSSFVVIRVLVLCVTLTVPSSSWEYGWWDER